MNLFPSRLRSDTWTSLEINYNHLFLTCFAKKLIFFFLNFKFLLTSMKSSGYAVYVGLIDIVPRPFWWSFVSCCCLFGFEGFLELFSGFPRNILISKPGRNLTHAHAHRWVWRNEFFCTHSPEL